MQRPGVSCVHETRSENTSDLHLHDADVGTGQRVHLA